MRPVMPLMKPTGTKMPRRTSVVATTALVTSLIAWIVASFELSPRVSMRYWTRSTTTMQSSTTTPIDKTSPNRVRMLIEYPSAAIRMNVAQSETGIVRHGISVARQSCRKR